MTLPISRNGRKYGKLYRAPSPKDYLAKNLPRKIAPNQLPSKVDLSGCLGPVKDQGDLGACTAFAASYAREFLTNAYVGKSKFTPLSPLFLYYQERLLDGDVGEDNGSTVAQSVNCLRQFGICPETDDPYNPANFTNAPTQTDYTDGLKYVIGAYHRLDCLNDFRYMLADGFCCLLGFDVYESFESNAVAQTGVVPMPKSNEQLLGGHAVCVYGYDNTFTFPDTGYKGALLVRNSWGSDWGCADSLGRRGNFLMPYGFLDHYVSDCWTLHLGAAWN